MIYLIRDQDKTLIYFARKPVLVMNYKTWCTGFIKVPPKPDCLPKYKQLAWYSQINALQAEAHAEYLKYLERCGLKKVPFVEIDW